MLKKKTNAKSGIFLIISLSIILFASCASTASDNKKELTPVNESEDLLLYSEEMPLTGTEEDQEASVDEEPETEIPENTEQPDGEAGEAAAEEEIPGEEGLQTAELTDPAPVEEPASRASVRPVRPAARVEEKPAPVSSARETARPETLPESLSLRETHAETLYAREGDMIQYPLAEAGWIYTGSAPDNKGIVFRMRDIRPDSSCLFTFRAEKLGEYVLSFSRLDLSKGTEENHAVQVKVLDDTSFAAALDEKVSESDTGELEGFFEAGEYGKIVDYFNGKTPSTSRQFLILAVSRWKTGDYPGAQKILSDLYSFENEVRDEAIAYARDMALEIKDTPLVLELVDIPGFFDLDHSPESLAGLGAFATEARKYSAGIRAYRLLWQRFREYPRMDEILWLLGNLLENPGEYRDLAEAMDVYSFLVDEYPASRYYEKAEDRIRFLKRHYIRIY